MQLETVFVAFRFKKLRSCWLGPACFSRLFSCACSLIPANFPPHTHTTHAQRTNEQTNKRTNEQTNKQTNNLHKSDRRAREKAIAERERGLHRLTKPRAVWCPRDAAQGEATNPRDAAELSAKCWSRIWRVHVESCKQQTGRRETPDGEDMSVLPQLEVGRTIWLRRSGRPVQGLDGHWCLPDAIHPSTWSRISEKANICTPTF